MTAALGTGHCAAKSPAMRPKQGAGEGGRPLTLSCALQCFADLREHAGRSLSQHARHAWHPRTPPIVSAEVSGKQPVALHEGRSVAMARDDFPNRTRDALARRVNLLCSNPGCGKPTSGPHSDPGRALNIGVAAHITAAAPGGPRYEGTATVKERSSFQNGIWLCQSCAKLVDNDPVSFTVSLLHAWKDRAEAKALAALSGRALDDLPQPPGAKHTPLPRIRWLPYDQARAHLIDYGWHPVFRHWADANDPDISLGNGPHYWAQGFKEIVSACPTGTAACIFAFRDAYGHALEVVTEGDADPEIGAEAIVMSWRIQDVQSPSPQSHAAAPQTQEIIHITRRITPTNLFDSIEVGTPSEKVRQRIGTPDLVQGNTWQYRFSDTQVEVMFDAESVRSVVVALKHDCKYHGLDAPFGAFVLGEITVQDLVDMGHEHIKYRDSMRTREIVVPVRVGPPGAWSECFFGALVVLSGAGALAATDFDWDLAAERLASPANATLFNWIGIGGFGGDPPYFSWFIE